jgi:4-hydroxy-tetrahydrodipicolinate reductase
MAKTGIIVHGGSGRMGQEIIALIEKSSQFSLVGVVDQKSKGQALKDMRPPKGSVLVDFSSPAGMVEAAKWCAAKKIAMVSGTTGGSKSDHKELLLASAKTAVLYSPNMSIGINIFLKIIDNLSTALKKFDLQIEEYHHSKKVDSPSGTAKILQEATEKAAGVKLPPIMSGRGGGIVGQHKLMIMGEEETLSIEHVALQRQVFARGALAAAAWVVKQKPGQYQMKDFLND